MKSTIILNSLLAGILLAAPLSAASVNVSFMTSGLPAGNYLFDFQFIDGDNATGNNTATISGFAVSNLTLGSLSTFGTVTGTDLVSGLTLTDGAMTEVDQAFTASSTAGNVSFTVNYTNNDTAPGPGDAFTFAITDTMLNSTRSAGNGAEPSMSFPPMTRLAVLSRVWRAVALRRRKMGQPRYQGWESSCSACSQRAEGLRKRSEEAGCARGSPGTELSQRLRERIRRQVRSLLRLRAGSHGIRGAA